MLISSPTSYLFVSGSVYEIAISFLASLGLVWNFRVLTLLAYVCLQRAGYPQTVSIHSKDPFVLW